MTEEVVIITLEIVAKTLQKNSSRTELRGVVLNELHQSPYSMHLSYHNITQMIYFWLGMKKDIASYIS